MSRAEREEREEREDPELAALRAEVEQMERALIASAHVEDELGWTAHQIESVIAITKDIVAISERGVILEVNHRFSEVFGYGSLDILGKSPLTVHPPEACEAVRAHMQSGDESPYEALCQRKDGSLFLAEIHGRVIRYQGRRARLTVIHDITEEKQARDARRAAEVEREVLEAQAALLSALSTPLLPIREGVLVLPLIGVVTHDRAEQVLTTLVEGISAHRAEVAVLDVTGVASVDAHVADALIRAARASALLGARVILTGIRPEVAARLVHLGINLTGLVTCGTLQRGVAEALAGRSAERP